MRQQIAPALDLGQERRVHLGGAALAALGLGVFVESAAQDGITGEDGGDLVPAVGVLVEGQVHDPGGGRLIGFVRLDPAVVDRELFEVGEDAQGQLGAPRVAAELVGRVHVAFDVHRGLLGLDEELARAADAEAVVGRLGAAAHLDGLLVHHVLVGLGVALLVGDVPAQRLEEGVDELAADLGFVVRAAAIAVQVGAEALDEIDDGCWGWHEGASLSSGLRVRKSTPSRDRHTRGGGFPRE